MKQGDHPFSSNFDSAREEAELGGGLQSEAYKLAYIDEELLCREETRPIRFQLELLKAELTLKEAGVESTIVIFGSARTLSQEKARQQLSAAEREGSEPMLQQARRDLENSRYYEEARVLARRIAEYSQQQDRERRLYVMTGGGPGIMEAANRGASEAGADSIGLNIVLPHEQAPNAWISPQFCFRFHYFAIRKMHFLLRARALVVFPGGYGTLDELFEALTLIQTRKAQNVPVIMVGEAFWRHLINFDFLLDQGTISAGDLELFQYAESGEQAWQLNAEHYQLEADSQS